MDMYDPLLKAAVLHQKNLNHALQHVDNAPPKIRFFLTTFIRQDHIIPLKRLVWAPKNNFL